MTELCQHDDDPQTCPRVPATPPTRLYSEPGDETMDASLDAAVQTAMDRSYPDESGAATIEEWSVHPPMSHLPAASHLLEWIEEWACEFGEIVEDFHLPIDRPEVKAAADHLLATIADHTTWRMANERVGVHRVAWGPDGVVVDRIDGGDGP